MALTMKSGGNGGPIKLHQSYARTGKPEAPSGSCGCASLASVQGGGSHPDAGMTHRELGDHERSGPPNIARGGGRMGATAHSDHGPHHIPR